MLPRFALAFALATSVAACGRLRFDDHVAADGSSGPADGRGVRVVRVRAGAAHTCALSSRGEVTCWGQGTWGILGQGDELDVGAAPGPLAHVDLGPGVVAVDLASVADYTCALLSDGGVKCWGNNDGTQLGTGDSNHRGDQPGEMGAALLPVGLGFAVDQVVAGHYHTCVRAGSDVRCWGLNEYGQLGDGDALPRASASQLANLALVDLGTGFVTTQIVASFNSTCAIAADHRVKCWGYNDNGLLGLGDLDIRGDNPGELGDTLAPVDLGATPATAVTGGSSNHCAILVGGAVKCWGINDVGELGIGDTRSRGGNPGEMGDALPAVDLGVGASAVEVTAGGGHVCARLESGAVKCWGRNTSGQLGQGDTMTRGDQPGQLGDVLAPVPLADAAVGLALGGQHSCAVLADGDLQCWGANQRGPLGLGDTEARGDQPSELAGTVLAAARLFPSGP